MGEGSSWVNMFQPELMGAISVLHSLKALPRPVSGVLFIPAICKIWQKTCMKFSGAQCEGPAKLLWEGKKKGSLNTLF